jgi:lysozyme
VLVNMAFNLGPTRLKGFKKFIAAFDAKDWDGAVIEMLDSKWAKQVGARAIRLAKMVRTGVAE